MANLLTQRELNILRGKALVNAVTREELFNIFEHIDAIELKLDEADDQDMLGTEGWRHWMGYLDA